MNDPKLDPRSLELLRRGSSAPPEAFARVRSKLLAAAAAGDLSHAAAKTAGHIGKRTLALTAFALGSVAGAALHAALAKKPAPQIVYIERSASTVAVAAPTPPLETPVPTLPRMTADGGAPRFQLSAPRGSQLAAERALLDQARGALVQGNPSGAIASIERHRRSFPSPILGEERDAMEIEALVKVGRYDEARERAKTFHDHTPDSLFLPTVDSAIAAIP